MRVRRPERGVAARHQNVEVCAVGAFAQFLFYRFHVREEPVLDFSSRDAWYKVKLLVSASSKDPTAQISWDVQARLLRKAFDSCSISSSHLTHAMRSGGAQFASAAGCTEDAIRKHGRWCGDRLMERYLTSVTLQPIRALSGFSIVGGDYWLPRSVNDPPTTLSEQIFPWIEAKHEEVKKRGQAGGEADGAALQFLDMLKYLRVVLLQDSALLQAKFPSFPLWNHLPFSSAEFAAYAQNLLQTISTTTSPFEVSVTQLVPFLGTALGHVRSELSALTEKIQKLDSDAERQERRHDEQFGALAANMDGITHLFVAAQQSEQRLKTARNAVAESLRTLSILSCQLSSNDGAQTNAQHNSIPALTLGPATATPGTAAVVSTDADTTTTTTARTDLTLTPGSTEHQSLQLPAPPHQYPLLLPSPTAAAPLALPAAAALGSAVDYQLPSVGSVEALWREWTEGQDGRLALGAMDAVKDVRLRGSSSMKQQVYRWRKITAFIKEMGEHRVQVTVTTLDRLLETRKGGLRLLAEELAKKDGKEKWSALLQV